MPRTILEKIYSFSTSMMPKGIIIPNASKGKFSIAIMRDKK